MTNLMDFKSMQWLSKLKTTKDTLPELDVHQRIIVIYVFILSFIKFTTVVT